MRSAVRIGDGLLLWKARRATPAWRGIANETWHRLHERTKGTDAVGTPRSTDSFPRKLRGFRPESPPWRKGRRERRDRHQGGDAVRDGGILPARTADPQRHQSEVRRRSRRIRYELRTHVGRTRGH